MYSSDSFEAFLKTCMEHGHTQVKLVPRLDADGSVFFYATGQGGPNTCADFDGSVDGDSISGPEVAPAPEVEVPMEQPTEPYAEDKAPW